MGAVPQEAIKQFEALMEQVDETLQRTFQNVHQGYPPETLMRFIAAREGNVEKAHKMLLDCLKWRMKNEIDDILAKPIVPVDLYRGIRNSQLIGLSGYTREGLPVFAIGLGISTFDKASAHYYKQSHIQINEYRDRIILPAASKKYGKRISKCVKILDMTGLKLSALSHIKLLTEITSIDDVNYPEKTVTYYIVNAPYIFASCWKVVRPLLHERTRKKIQVLSGCGRDDLLKIMDYSSLPHFCRNEGSGSSPCSGGLADNCYSLDHPFHQDLYEYINQQAQVCRPAKPLKQGSVHVDLPEDVTEGTDIIKTLESEFLRVGIQDELAESSVDLKTDNK